MKTIKPKPGKHPVTINQAGHAPKRKPGRPTTYTEEIVEEIAERLSKGEPLAQICRDEGMPHPSTVRDWMAAHESVSRRIARAREDGFDAIAADALSIADDGTRDYQRSEQGALVVDHDHIQRSKLRVDTRLKLLAKWDPKRYGERVAMEHTGADGGPIQTQTIDPGKLSDAVLQELMNARAGTDPG